MDSDWGRMADPPGQTSLKVKDGETIVIGGLIQTTDSVSRDKVPLLGDIPILGVLFSHETTTQDESELEIYVTPRLLPLGPPERPRGPASLEGLLSPSPVDEQLTGVGIS